MPLSPEGKAAWHQANRERRLAEMATYRAEHREELRAKAAILRQQPEYRAYMRRICAERYLRKKAEIREKQKQRYREHPEAWQAGHHNRKARLRGAKGNVTLKERQALLQQQAGRCFWCDCSITDTGGDAALDHVMPIALGGEHHISNVVLACHPCNSSKKNLHPVIWNPERWARFQAEA